MDSQTVLTVQDEKIIENHGRTVGAHFHDATTALQNFIDFISNRQYRLESFCRVASVFRKGLMSACSEKGMTRKHAENLARVVLQVLQNPGWLLLDMNASRNASRNASKTCQRIKTQETVAEELSLQVPAETKPNLLSLCTLCNKPGLLVICEGIYCLNRFHWKCAGINGQKYSQMPYFCKTCNSNSV